MADKKRRMDEEQAPVDGPPAPSDYKRRKLAEATAASAPSSSDSPGPARPNPSAPSVTSERDPYVFYPDNYKDFDVNKLICDKDPIKPKIGSGMMIFPAYIFPDGKQRPLQVQGPKMFLPSGIMTFRDESKETMSMLCSFGKEWESNPDMVAFYDLCRKIRTAAAKMCFNKGLGQPLLRTEAEVERRFAEPVFISTKYDEADPEKPPTVYPPSLKLGISTAVNNKTRFYIMLPPDPAAPEVKRFSEVTQSSVARGCTVIPSIQFRWIFRKKAKEQETGREYFNFNLHPEASAVAIIDSSEPRGASGKLNFVL